MCCSTPISWSLCTPERHDWCQTVRLCYSRNGWCWRPCEAAYRRVFMENRDEGLLLPTSSTYWNINEMAQNFADSIYTWILLDKVSWNKKKMLSAKCLYHFVLASLCQRYWWKAAESRGLAERRNCIYHIFIIKFTEADNRFRWYTYFKSFWYILYSTINTTEVLLFTTKCNKKSSN